MLFNHLILCHPLLLPSTIPSIRVFSMSHRIIGTLLGLAFWDWNENWPFLILWPLLSFPNLLTYWVQHLNASFITSPCMYYLLSHVQLFVTPWTVTCQAPESVHGILQARIQEWVAILFCGGSSWLRDQTQASCIADRFFTRRALGNNVSSWKSRWGSVNTIFTPVEANTGRNAERKPWSAEEYGKGLRFLL